MNGIITDDQFRKMVARHYDKFNRRAKRLEAKGYPGAALLEQFNGFGFVSLCAFFFSEAKKEYQYKRDIVDSWWVSPLD